MQEDLITNSFIDGVNRTVVRRNVILSKIALILWTLYIFTVLLDWYDLLKDLGVSPKGSAMIYFYRVLPVIELVLLAINTYGYILIVRGYRSINISFERSEPGLLATGFKCFYRSNILLILSIAISIIASLLKHFLSNN